jgi:integrase
MPANSIVRVDDRRRLTLRREPYWHYLRKGCYLGFRKMTDDGAGNWLARARDEFSGQQAYKSLGDFEDLAPTDRFGAASKAAAEWFDHLGKGGAAGPTSVRTACSRYVDHLRATKGDKAADDAQARFDNYVLNDPRLAELELGKLTPAHFEQWRKALRELPTRSGPNRGKPRTDSTLNRDMTCLRAALNLAYRDGLTTSDFAWRAKLVPLKNADRRRELYLDRAQRRRFIAKAAPELAAFLRGLALLPLRPGALAALTAADYDRRLQLLRIGKDKAGADRKIRLPANTAALFDKAVKGKPASAPIFARADGKAWDKDSWKWPVKAAAQAAKLPHATTAYALRHSVITDLVTGGLDLLTVAQISGTSVAMIERHYGTLRGNVAASALAKLRL